MHMCNSIASIFGTNEESIKVNSHTRCALSLMGIQEVMSVYSYKKDQTSVMATECMGIT